MKFLALESTQDGRLTKGKIYEGNLVGMGMKGDVIPQMVLRVAVYDNTGEAMTFSPKVFQLTDQHFTTEQMGFVAGGTVAMVSQEYKIAAANLFSALSGIIEIGKRDMSNTKYDGYFKTAKENLAAYRNLVI